jgi:hypothetical protein
MVKAYTESRVVALKDMAHLHQFLYISIKGLKVPVVL